MSFLSIKNILNKQIKNKPGLSKQIQAVLVCEEFDKIVQQKWGDKIKNKTKALYVKNKVLTIASLSSVIAQEIKLYEKEILDQINKKFNDVADRVRYLT